MVSTKFFLLFCIFFALVKISILDEDDYSSNEIDFIAFGAENYKVDKAGITFKLLFMNLSKKNITKSFRINTNITYLKNSSDSNSSNTEHKEINCTIENIKQNDDYIYYNCVIYFPNISNINQIDIWGGGDYFGGEVVPGYLILDPNYNLMKATKELYILNLTKEIEEKNGQFILKGEMHKNLNDNEEFKLSYNDMNGTLKCQKVNGLFYECKLLPTSLIENRTIEQRVSDSSKSKIIIIARFLKNIYISYPKNSTINNSSEKTATIISVGNFNHDKNSLADAIGKIYLLCTDYSLKYLKEFIRFYVDINYNQITKLRMLQSEEKIEVIGTKNLSQISKHIVSYDLTYKNTTQKKILEISSPCNISFSNNDTFIEENNEMNIDFNEDETYEFLEEKEKKYELMNIKTNNKGNYDAIINSDSFSFGFDTQDDILNIENNTQIEVSYKPYDEERFFNICNIEKSGSQSYIIKCSPKRSVYASMKTIAIDITNLLKNRRLNSVSARILEDAANTILIPPVDTPGVINYQYEKIGTFIPKKKNSGGLSGGVIAAIVIPSVVVILVVLFLIYFFNRPSVPFVKCADVKNIPNSSTSINN